MSRIETDLGNMRARANAWAVGDIEALRALPFHNQYVDCLNAITETGPARRLGMDDLHERVDGAWMEAAEDRSEEHTSELQSLMRISYAVFCLKQKTNNSKTYTS